MNLELKAKIEKLVHDHTREAAAFHNRTRELVGASTLSTTLIDLEEFHVVQTLLEEFFTEAEIVKLRGHAIDQAWNETIEVANYINSRVADSMKGHAIQNGYLLRRSF